MSESSATKSNVFKEDMALATGGTGAAESGTRKTSTGSDVTLTKLDASHLKFKTLAQSLDDLVDGGQDVHIKPSSVTMNGTLTNDTMTSAGYLKNTDGGVVSGGNAIAAADLPTAIDAIKIANGTVNNAEFQYLNGVTSDIQTQINNAPKIAQVVNTMVGTTGTGSTGMPGDNTIPQITEGDEYMTLTITPNNISNTLKIDIVAFFRPDQISWVIGALFKDSEPDALAAIMFTIPTVNYGGILSFSHYMTAGSVSPITFRLRVGPAKVGGAGTVNLTFNGAFGGVSASSMTITEIKA